MQNADLVGDGADRSDVAVPYDVAVPRLTPLLGAPLRAATKDGLRVLVVGDVELDIDGHRLLVQHRVVPAAEQELRLLAVLMANAGRVLARRFLLDEAWRVGYPDHNKTLEVHVRRIRGKIDRPGVPSHIRTVRGIGYVFDRPLT